MGWANCGKDSKGRDIGYAHEVTCDHPGCSTKIDHGLAYACAGMHGEIEVGCEGYFCDKHLGNTILFNGEEYEICDQCKQYYLGNGEWMENDDGILVENTDFNFFEKLICKIFNMRTIVNCDRDPYLHRWYIFRSKRLGVFLHKFVRSDEDRALHDHPWNFFGIVLKGGYMEHFETKITCPRCNGRGDIVGTIQQTMRGLPWVNCPGCDGDGIKIVQDKKWRGIFSWTYQKAEYKHRVELIENRPSWSLFIRFRERREWGFWLKTGWQKWNERWKEKCE